MSNNGNEILSLVLPPPEQFKNDPVFMEYLEAAMVLFGRRAMHDREVQQAVMDHPANAVRF